MKQCLQICCMFWLNVDKINNIWKLHRESCRHAKPQDTEFKGKEEMKRNGGWFKFSSIQEAYEFFKRNNEDAVWQPCKVCNPE